MPKIFSIITPAFNSEKFIQESLTSLHEQDFEDFEHIVIDGGSTDRTHQIIQSFPKAQLIIEPDRGLYDALNKGLRKASGEWVGFLNTDDFYLPGVLEKTSKFIEANPNIDAVVGDSGWIIGKSRKRLHYVPAISEDTFLHDATAGFPMFNAWFFKRKLLLEMEGFNIQYSLGADKDLLLRLYSRRFNFLRLGYPVYCYRRHQGSLTGKFGWNQKHVEADFEQICDYLENRTFQGKIGQAVEDWYRTHLFRMTYWSLFYLRPFYTIKLIKRGIATVPDYGAEIGKYTFRKMQRVFRKLVKRV